MRLTPPKVLRCAADLGVQVLLHHGFLVDFNSLWYRSGLVIPRSEAALAATAHDEGHHTGQPRRVHVSNHWYR